VSENSNALWGHHLRHVRYTDGTWSTVSIPFSDTTGLWGQGFGQVLCFEEGVKRGPFLIRELA